MSAPRRRANPFVRVRATLRNVVEHVRESYWALPGGIAGVGVALAFAVGMLDVAAEFEAIRRIGFGPELEAESARTVLSTIAGATLGVAGVAFSILIAAVVFASGQFGPRIIGSFMRERGNQIALGVFLATYLYCVLVLRLVGEGHVPPVSLLLAFVLAVASIATLIQFFHNAPESIRLSAVVARVGSDLVAMVAERFPLEAPADAAAAPRAPADALALHARATGSLRIVDFAGLAHIVAAYGACLRVDRMPGDFVVAGRPIGWIWPAGSVDEAGCDEIRRAFEVGASRTQAQDVRFPAQLLIDVAERGLSPGINDPRTAMACLDWLSAGLARAARGHPLSAVLRDEEGAPRVVLRCETFASLADFVLGHLRPHFQTEPAAAMHMMATIGTLILHADHATHRAILLDHARALADGAAATLSLPADTETVARRLAAIERIVAEGTSPVEAMARHPWL